MILPISPYADELTFPPIGSVAVFDWFAGVAGIGGCSFGGGDGAALSWEGCSVGNGGGVALTVVAGGLPRSDMRSV